MLKKKYQMVVVGTKKNVPSAPRSQLTGETEEKQTNKLFTHTVRLT